MDAALSAFLETEAQDPELTFVSTLPPEQPGEDPRMATLREIERQSQFMRTKKSKRDFFAWRSFRRYVCETRGGIKFEHLLKCNFGREFCHRLLCERTELIRSSSDGT